MPSLRVLCTGWIRAGYCATPLAASDLCGEAWPASDRIWESITCRKGLRGQAQRRGRAGTGSLIGGAGRSAPQRCAVHYLFTLADDELAELMAETVQRTLESDRAVE